MKFITSFFTIILFFISLWIGAQTTNSTSANTEFCLCQNNTIQEDEEGFYSRFNNNVGQYGFPEHDEFLSGINWDFEGGKSFFDSLYPFDIHAYASGSWDFVSYTTFNYNLLSKSPIKLYPKSKAFSINFTPCKNGFGYSLETGCTEYGNIQGIDYENFDSSAASFLDLILAIKELQYPGNDNSVSSFLSQYLMENFSNYYSDSLNQIIIRTNRKYGFKVPLATPNQNNGIDESFIEPVEDEDNYPSIDSLLKSFESGKVDVKEYVLWEFIREHKSKQENGNHKITKIEEEKLLEFFNNDYYSVEELYNTYIKKKRTLDFYTTLFSLEINPAVISAWDSTINISYYKNNSRIQAAKILFFTEKFRISSDKGLTAFGNVTCPSRVNIAGTRILLSLMTPECFLVAPKYLKTEPFHRNIKVECHPFFIVDSIGQQPIYAQALSRFNGLILPYTEIYIPHNGSLINVSGRNIIINNDFVSGEITIPFSLLNISQNDLHDIFLYAGLQEIKIDKKDKWHIYFRKKVIASEPNKKQN